MASASPGQDLPALFLVPWQSIDDEVAVRFLLSMYSQWSVQRFIGTEPRIIDSPDQARGYLDRFRRPLPHPGHGIWALIEGRSGRTHGHVVYEEAPSGPAIAQKPLSLVSDGRDGVIEVGKIAPSVRASELRGVVLCKPIPFSSSECPIPPLGHSHPGSIGGVTNGQREQRGLDTEIGWHLHPDSWGQGLATRGAELALRWAQYQGVSHIVAVTNPANHASGRVALRLGMKCEGLTRRYYDTTTMLYSIGTSPMNSIGVGCL